MKKLILLLVFLTITSSLFSLGDKKILPFNEEEYNKEQELYGYNKLVYSLNKVTPPVVRDDYIVFTYETGPRVVGIAFDFEEYSTIHVYGIHTGTDYEDNITSSVLFYLLKRPATLSYIKYRLIVDGLWTTDITNPLSEYDPKTGIRVSCVDLKGPLPLMTGDTHTDGANAVFIYRGNEGQSIRLAGTFTNWDSWIYTLKEESPGFYKLTLCLPRGTYYYNYYTGMTAIIDKTNPHRAYTKDGKIASVIKIE